MIDKPVPMATCITASGGNPNKGKQKTSAGIIVSPPPKPNKLDKRPAEIPADMRIIKLDKDIYYILFILVRMIKNHNEALEVLIAIEKKI